eukprot:scaffold246216_cov52-Prasinocladus_malaysianus.AAC.3
MEEEFMGKLKALEAQVERELAAVLAAKFDFQEGSRDLETAVEDRKAGSLRQDEWQPLLSKVGGKCA